jgi:hypothetical protein
MKIKWEDDKTQLTGKHIGNNGKKSLPPASKKLDPS